jgi:hypothetical protein
MDGFKNTTKIKYMNEGGQAVVYQGRNPRSANQMANKAGRMDAKADRMEARADRMDARAGTPQRQYAKGGDVSKKGGQPVQKKSLGGILEKVAPFGLAGLVAGGGLQGAMMGSGIGLIAQLLKKKKANIPLTAAEQAKVDAAGAGQTQPGAPATMKHGGMAKKHGGMAKKGVPVASKRPMVGLGAMPKKK